MEIIIAIIGTFTAVITICLTNYLNKKSEIKQNERKLKEQYYFEYLNAISKNINYNNKESVLEENEAFNRLILIANSYVLKRLYEFQDFRINCIKRGKTKNFDSKYEELFNKLIIEIRKDLYGKKNEKLPKLYLLGGYIQNSTEVK